VAGSARDLQRTVGAHDRDRLDQYFTSVRESRKTPANLPRWERKLKPVVHVPVPLDPASPREYMEKVKLMYDLARSLSRRTPRARFRSCSMS